MMILTASQVYLFLTDRASASDVRPKAIIEWHKPKETAVQYEACYDANVAKSMFAMHGDRAVLLATHLCNTTHGNRWVISYELSLRSEGASV